LWFAGRPKQALDHQEAVLERERNARDRFKGEAWIAVMEAMAGHVDRAVDHLGRARRLLGEQPPLVGQGQIVGVELLLRLARGDEDGAAAGLAAVLRAVPLGDGVSEQNLRPMLAMSYVLVAESRAYWDEDDLGPAQLVARDLSVALLGARAANRTMVATMKWPTPGVIAANFPARWAIEFGLHGLVTGRQEGRALIAWLCENWGDPAREVLREFSELDGDLGVAASDALAHTPVPPTQRVALELLGSLRLSFDGYETADPAWRRERVRALLTWLVLHRGGQRDELADALWPDLPADKALKNLRTTLNYVHGVLEPRRATRDAPWFVRVDAQRIDLHPDLDVDLWRFVETLDRAEEAERSGAPSEALPLLLDGVGRYRGELAAGLDYAWLDLERIHVRSRFVRSSCRAGELLTAMDRADESVDLFRAALRADEWHERTYRGLIDAYRALGDRTAAEQVAEHAREHVGELSVPRRRM
jgi:DNA-binding SARP family transcriptional activator